MLKHKNLDLKAYVVEYLNGDFYASVVTQESPPRKLLVLQDDWEEVGGPLNAKRWIPETQ